MKTLMKRFFVVLVMATIITSTLPLFVNASNEQNALEYELEDKHCTVVFEDELAEERMELIAKRLLGIDVETAAPCGLMCTLFGHKYGPENGVDVITHNARTSAPRCLSERYLVKVCSRCDDTVSTLKSRTYIYCH